MSITRRQALSTLSGGLAGLMAWPAWLRADDRPLPRFSFLVVTDTHLGRGDRATPTENWEKTARELDAAEGDLVLHLGDIVDGGREKYYGEYREIRGTIRKPVHDIPGNHDPEELFAKNIRATVDQAFDHKGVRFLLVNNSRPDSHDGFLGDRQLSWLEKQCAEAARAGLVVILGMHVPAHSNKHPDRGWYIKPANGQTQLYALLERHRDRVLALVHGHFHNGVRGWDDHAPLQEVCFPSALYNKSRRLAEQKAPGYYMAELRPGYTRVTLEQEGMRLTYQPVGVKDKEERVCPLPQLAR